MKIALLGVFVLAMAGCTLGSSDDDDSIGATGATVGRDGRISFDSSRSIATSPLLAFMTGGQRRISLKVTRKSDSMLLAKESNPQFVSADPSVSTVDVAMWVELAQSDGTKMHGVNLNVKALKQGSAELRVLGAGGQPLDRVEIRVADAARIALEDHESAPVTEIALAKSASSFHVKALAFDVTGAPLDADEGFTFESADTSVASIAPSCPSILCFGDTENNVYVAPKAEGTTSLTVTVESGASASAPIRVTP